MRPLAIVWLLAVVASAGAAEQVEVEVAAVARDPGSGAPVVRLAEKGGGRTLPIWVGPFEAQAIALELRGLQPPRPLTHDLMTRIVQALGAGLERVEVTGLQGQIYVAALHLRSSAGEPLAVDARPSDAIALAVRLKRPIIVAAGLFPEAELRDGERVARLYGLTVQELTPALAAAVGQPGLQGALVSEVDPGGPAARVRRGDVITGVDDGPVGSPVELVTAVATRPPGAKPPRLGLNRAGRSLTVRVRARP